MTWGQIRFYIEINTGSHLPEIYYWRGVSYTEPIGKQMLQVYYRHEYQRQSNNAVTYNLDEDALWGSLPSGYEAGVDSLSDYTRNDLHSNEFGLRTTLNWRKVRLNIRFGLSPQNLRRKATGEK